MYINELLCFVTYAQWWGIFVRIEWNENRTEIVVVAYLDCIHEFISITFIVFITNITWSYILATYNSHNCSHAVVARKAGACMRLYSFAVQVSQLYMFTLANKLICSYFTSNELTDKRSCMHSPYDGY